MRRVVAPEAVARSMMTRLTPRAYLRISAVSASCGGGFGAQRLGIESDHLDGRVATGGRWTEGAYQAGTLIAGAEEERQQAVGRGIDQQNALTARGERAAKRCHEAGFAHAAGQRKDGENGSARGHGRRRRLRVGTLSSKTLRRANQREARRSREPCNESSGEGGSAGAPTDSGRSGINHAGRPVFSSASVESHGARCGEAAPSCKGADAAGGAGWRWGGGAG